MTTDHKNSGLEYSRPLLDKGDFLFRKSTASAILVESSTVPLSSVATI
jgi:hypothetical protein